MSAVDMIDAMGASAYGQAGGPSVQRAWAGAGQGMAGLMGGNAAAGELAYQKGANAGLDMQIKQLKAREERDKAMARDGTLDKLNAAFPDMPIEQRALMANTMMSGQGSDLNATMGAMGKYQENTLRGNIATEADPVARNQMAQAISGRPEDLTKISGGTAYNPGVLPGMQEMMLTPDAAADNTRAAGVAESQIDRNVAGAEKSRRPAAGRAAEGLDTFTAKQKIAALTREYGVKLKDAPPAERASLLATRDAQIAAVSQGLDTRAAQPSDDIAQAVGMWAEDMKATLGVVPDAGQLEEAKQRLKRGEPLVTRQPVVNTNDGRHPPQVVNANGKPITDVAGTRAPTAAQQMGAELPPALDYVNGGNKGAPTAAKKSTSIPEAAAAKLREGQPTTFKNGTTWTLRNGIPVQI